MTYEGDDLEAVARRLGVQPSVLTDAQAALTAERKRAGLIPVAVGTRSNGAESVTMELEMPESVYQDWKAYCAFRDMSPSVLLRSLIHTLLSGPENPSWVGRGWIYRGKRLKLAGYGEKRGGWPWTAKAAVTHGALRALTKRADRATCTVTGLMRGAVVDLLEGRTKTLHVITVPAEMWDDENRYWTGDPTELDGARRG